MFRPLSVALCALWFAAPAVGQGAGDPEAGARAFRNCTACHAVVADDGRVLVPGGRAGPNLYGIAGRRAGTVAGFNYGDSLQRAGAQGLTWTQETFVDYLVNPTEYLKEWLGDDSARGTMAFRMKANREDLWAYLRSLEP
ncbi:cytochrome C550 [Roseivivax isoporae LMG 25204]|uniref:Cytochrome C550 n=1 Tax=Roseivivax isoporae LMG 25204 TaxID=1449351 RepID=X7F9U3_9RHOB|nr:cytochrome C550 [Roseivivax isoporae LMG 25204]